MKPRSHKTMVKSSLLRAICRYELNVLEVEVEASKLYKWIKKQVENDHCHVDKMVTEMKKLLRVASLNGDFG